MVFEENISAEERRELATRKDGIMGMQELIGFSCSERSLREEVK